ncbi:MAG: hypothetical protein PHN72_06005 [Bacilli bacterium]|nr:hypothetical protein [Bacilli bacterium]
MKKLKIYKGLIVLSTALSISMATGCTAEKEEDKKVSTEEDKKASTEEENNDSICTHAIIQFGNTQVILRECAEDYNSKYRYTNNYIGLEWNIYEKGASALDDPIEIFKTSKYSDYTIYKVTHKPGEVPELEQKAIDDGAYVYTYHK